MKLRGHMGTPFTGEKGLSGPTISRTATVYTGIISLGLFAGPQNTNCIWHQRWKGSKDNEINVVENWAEQGKGTEKKRSQGSERLESGKQFHLMCGRFWVFICDNCGNHRHAILRVLKSTLDYHFCWFVCIFTRTLFTLMCLLENISLLLKSAIYYTWGENSVIKGSSERCHRKIIFGLPKNALLKGSDNIHFCLTFVYVPLCIKKLLWNKY